jgi:hypothetical protein
MKLSTRFLLMASILTVTSTAALFISGYLVDFHPTLKGLTNACYIKSGTGGICSFILWLNYFCTLLQEKNS